MINKSLPYGVKKKEVEDGAAEAGSRRV